MIESIIHFFAERFWCLIFGLVIMIVGLINPALSMDLARHALDIED